MQVEWWRRARLTASKIFILCVVQEHSMNNTIQNSQAKFRGLMVTRKEYSSNKVKFFVALVTTEKCFR